MSGETTKAVCCDGRLRHVVQGNIGVTDEKDIVFTAVLGTGILVCLTDRLAKVGGCAYFIFPDGAEYGPDDRRFGAPALAGLIHEVVGHGADRTRLEARVFGGAKMHDGRGDIGQRNVGFALAYLADSGISVFEQCLGGGNVRRIHFCPTTGQCENSVLEIGVPHEVETMFGAV